jgi:hypothetical protein
MSDFTETTSVSWFGRIGRSIKGILFGIILLPLSIILHSWNEGRAVTTARSLKEGAAAVVSVQSDAVLPDNEGKLIHLSGEVRSSDAVSDPIFGLSTEALKLTRVVEMFQWKESKHSDSRKKLGGGQETVTRYTYEKAWSEKEIDSSNFKETSGHQNPAKFPFPGTTTITSKATLGAFGIPADIIAKMGGGSALMPTSDCVKRLPENLNVKARLHGESVYFGADPEAPVIGDARVTFKAVKPAVFSILARQQANSLAAYQTKAGREIERVESGSISAEQMFKHAESENALMTWALRFAGFIVMLIGFSLLLNPLKVLADVVPFFGSIVGFGTGLVSLILAFTGSLVVIAVAWLAVRPLLGGSLLLIAAGAFVYGLIRFRRNRHSTVPAGA